MPLLPSLAAAALYTAASLYQGRRLAARQPLRLMLLQALALGGLLAHAGSLCLQLFSPQGLNLDFFQAASLIAWAVVALTLLGTLRLPASNLLLVLLPLAALSVLLAQFVPAGNSLPISGRPGILAHILLSLLAYGLLTIAMVQSLLLLLQDRQLKLKQPNVLTRSFPPLQTMESLLFALLWAGWLLLTLSLLSGWLYVDNLLAQHLAHKTLLSMLAWLVFGLLLWGRYQLGWRGHKAVRLTLAGFLL
ncbi:TPA: inner membrane protein YpjD, partial [Klebsiella pneumoniae]